MSAERPAGDTSDCLPDPRPPQQSVLRQSTVGRLLGLFRRVEGVSRPVALLLCWGVAAGVLAAILLQATAPRPWLIETSRAAELRDSLAILNHGGPLLLGRHPTGQLYAVGVTDDQGLFVYIPWLAHLLGLSDPVSLVRSAYVGMFAFTAALYPLMLWRLSRSVLAGLLAPIPLLFLVRSLGYVDLYWIVPWSSLTLLPVVYLLAEARLRPVTLSAAAVGLALAAGWITSLRSQVGLGILIPIAVVVLLRRWRWWRVGAVLVLMLAAYWSTASLVTAEVRAHRDARIGTTALSRDQPAGHPFWHTLYIGLGFLPNPYGIRYRDEIAQTLVQQRAPGTRFVSSRYETILRHAYLSILRRNPGEFARQYGAKVLVTVADCVPYLLAIALTMPWMLISGPRRRRRLLWLALTVPTLIITFAPPIMAIPQQMYEQGLYGTLGLLGIIGSSSIVERFVAFARAGEMRRRGSSRKLWMVSGISVAAILVLAPITLSAHPVRREAEAWQGIPFENLIDAVPNGRAQASAA
jgi:hypothetical protein